MASGHRPSRSGPTETCNPFVPLFDTDILSIFIRRRASQRLTERLHAVPASDRFTSSVTLGELYYGAFRLGPQGAGLLRRIEALPFELGQVLPFDTEAAHRYGVTKSELERRGTPLHEADLRIAAVALTHGLVVVTGNVRHFERVPGLTIENWLQ